MDSEAYAPGEVPVILIPLAGGGFLTETKELLADLSSDFAFTYLKVPWVNPPGEEGMPIGPCRDIPALDSFTEPSVLQCGWALTATFFAACGILSRSRVDLVIVIGSRHAFPMLLAGRLFRKRTVFIESLARASKLSRTGLFIRRCRLAHVFIVQWPALQRTCLGTRLGTVL